MHRRTLLAAWGASLSISLPGCSSYTTDRPTQVTTGQMDDMEDLSHWDVLDGSLSADGDHKVKGTQSARLDIDDHESRVRVAREFDRPIDIRGLAPRAAFRADGNIYPWIQVFDADRNRIDFRTTVRGGLDLQSFDFGVDAVEGDPDLSSIVEIRISQHVGDGTSRTIWCDDVGFSERPTDGKMLILFDDAYTTDYTKALPLLEEHGYTAGTFINPRLVNQESEKHLTLEQLEELQNAGWEVCNHTLNHENLTELSRAEQEATISDAKNWLVDHGFGSGAEYFAYPYHAYTQTTIDLVNQYHELGFAGGYPAIGEISNPYLIHRAEGDLSIDAARRAVDLTTRFGGVSVFYYHELTDDRYRDFEGAIEYISERANDGDLEVITIDEFQSEFV